MYLLHKCISAIDLFQCRNPTAASNLPMSVVVAPLVLKALKIAAGVLVPTPILSLPASTKKRLALLSPSTRKFASNPPSLKTVSDSFKSNAEVDPLRPTRNVRRPPSVPSDASVIFEVIVPIKASPASLSLNSALTCRHLLPQNHESYLVMGRHCRIRIRRFNSIVVRNYLQS